MELKTAVFDVSKKVAVCFLWLDTSFISGARQAKGDIISTKEKGLAQLTLARAVAPGELDTQHSQAGLDTLVEGSHDNPRSVGNTHC
ncbi:MAG: hypothetical protein AMJ37_04215 [Dehalococcoidia bacterium DG_18]|nr:MAG: hypothetical protein AMJ37_04215 [Dehalococcoidia bacterium DG_18]